MSTSASVEPILPQAATNPTGQGAEVTACAAATSGDKQSSRQDESKAGSALDQAVHGTNGDQKAKENDHVHGMRSGDGHSGALQTSSKTASLGAAADRNPADPAAPTSAPAPLANASTFAATRALSGDRKDLLLQLQSDVVKIEEALSREILLSQFFWSKQQNNDAPPSCPQPSDGSSEGQVNQTPLFFINDTPSLAAFIEGQSCTLTALVDKVLKVAAPPPSASGIVSSQPQQLDPTAVKAMVVELASRKNDYSLAKGEMHLYS